MSGNRDLRQWQAWREDSRCTRPAVTCQNCETHYPRGKDEGNATYHGYRLVKCGKCQDVQFVHRKAEIAKVSARIQRKLQQHIATRDAGKRRVRRDVACRYIAMFGGSTFNVQTDADDCEIYLRNKHGETIASVSLLNRFPEPVNESIFDEMPF